MGHSATASNRTAAMVLLLAPFAAGCGGKQEPPATPPPATALAASPAAAPAAPAAGLPHTTPIPEVPGAPAVRPAASARPTAGAATTTLPPTTVPPATPAAPPTPALSTAVVSPSALPPATTFTAAPTAKLPARPRPKGKVALPAKLGTVTFDHQKHAEAMAIPCAHCHHPSRPEKPLAAEQQACRECHTSPATPPLKTSLQAAFHDPKASAGTCLGCHREAVAQGKHPPVGCPQCHKRQ